MVGLELYSAHSMEVSLAGVRSGKHGLDAHRQSLLDRVPEQGDWSAFVYGTLELKDLAYLSAKTGDEFAILRGKREDILVHGTPTRCRFDGVLEELLMSLKS